ncbi:MAG TPA: hypothetical protein VNK73_04150 [Actinomycetota bacterium]|nr:hypothetical protein [Actinomycetota bacterium]
MERHEDLSTADFANPAPREARESDPADQVDVEEERRDDYPRDREPGELAQDPVETADRAPEPAAEPAAEPGWDAAPPEERPEAAPSVQPASDAGAGPLLAPDKAEGFRAHWTDVQNGFVDSPRKAVEEADGLVAELMQHLARTFADERSQLEHQWDRGDDVSTDDLRTAFQRYRSFFERLLST